MNETNQEFIHNNKTHRSSSEAFRDARHAEWFESDPEMSDMKYFIGEMLFICVPILALVMYVVVLLVRGL
jgi:hypothetical protein